MIHEHLQEADEHISIAVAKLNKIAGNAWVGSWAELQKLVRIQLSLKSLQQRIKHCEESEQRRKSKGFRK